MTAAILPRAAGLGLAAALTLASSVSSAQDGIALPRFDPAPAGDRFFGVGSPFAAGSPVAPHVMLLMDYAHNPLVFRSPSGQAVIGCGEPPQQLTSQCAVVEHQLFLHLNGGIALFDRLNINIDLPLGVFQQGGQPTVGGETISSPNSFTLGDLRVGARVRLYGDYYDGFQIGIGGYVWFPTSVATKEQAHYVSDQNVRGLPQLYLGGMLDRFVWSTTLGARVQADQRYSGGSSAAVSQSSMFDGGIGLGFRLGDERQVQIGPEAHVNFDLIQPDGKNLNLELLAGLKWRLVKDWELGVAGGPGLTKGIGTPDGRVVASIAYTPYVNPPVVDRDKDGVPDKEDACPDVPGIKTPDPKTNGCPPPPPDRDKDGVIDRDDACIEIPGIKTDDPKTNGCPPPPPDKDKDGIPDAEDACLEVPGVKSEIKEKNGCPPDKDGDGIYDADDACPDIKGVKSEDKTKNGCPPDTDGDGFRDDQDACPLEKGVDDPDPTKRGCPKLVRVGDKEVIILQQVQFDTGKATIKKESDELLKEVAEVLKEHPEITGLEVQGHTDNRAARAFNQKLSEDRAKAVKKALEARGVEAKRLTTKGFGMDRPIGDNKTDEGRQKNRRVVFIVTEKNGKALPRTDDVPPPEQPKAPPPPKAPKAPPKPPKKK